MLLDVLEKYTRNTEYTGVSSTWRASWYPLGPPDTPDQETLNLLVVSDTKALMYFWIDALLLGRRRVVGVKRLHSELVSAGVFGQTSVLI